jgi:hypothetical protein
MLTVKIILVYTQQIMLEFAIQILNDFWSLEWKLNLLLLKRFYENYMC